MENKELEDKAFERVRNIIEPKEDKLTIIEELTKLQIEALLGELGSETIPEELTYIVVETTIARYRRYGAEGITDKRVDVITHKYVDDLFEPYRNIIARHAKTPTTNKIVRMI